MAGLLAMAMVLTTTPEIVMADQMLSSDESVSVNALDEEECVGEAEVEPTEYFEEDVQAHIPGEYSLYEAGDEEEAEDEEGLLGATYADYEEDINKVAAVVRNNLVNRKSYFTVKVVSTLGITALKNEIMSRATAYTGNSSEGDYLRDSIGSFRVGMSRKGGKYALLSFGKSDGSSVVGYRTSLSQENYINQWTDQKIASYRGENNDEAKVRWIEKLIADTVDYDYAAYPAQQSYSAYGAIQGKAVCQGYVLLMYKMCLKMGIDCRILTHIESETDSSNNHAWCIVKVDGKYYNIDPTWDDQTEKPMKTVISTYYLKNDQDFRYDDDGMHIRDEEYRTEAFYRAHPMSATSFAMNKPTIKLINGTWYYWNYNKIDTTYTGIFEESGRMYYVDKGKVNFNYTNLIQYKGTWYYVKNGEVDKKANTLARVNNKGTWYYVKNGKIDWNFTGLFKYSGGWYYVQKGSMKSNFTGLVRHTDKKWYYVKKSKIDFKFNGLVQHTDKKWYYVQKGVINFKFTGLVQHTDKKWYYVEKGVINFKFTGLVKHTDKKLYYVQKGVINFKFNGTVKYNGKKYKVVKGVTK